MSEFVRARNSTEVTWSLDPFTIVKPHDPRFADIEKDLPREHFGVSEPVRRIFGDPKRAPGQVKFGIIGHRGTGKSTLIRKAMDDLRPLGIMPVLVDALTSVDQTNFGLADFMLVVVRSVIAELEAQQISLEPDVVATTYRWFADELISEQSRKQIEASIETSASAGVGFPSLAQFSAKLASALKTDNEYRVEIRQRALRDVNDLLHRVNRVLDGAHAALAQRKQQLCVVFDNLEKVIDRELVAKAVLVPAQEIRELRCHLVLFLHPADDYAPTQIAASQCFRTIHVPALPVRFKGDDTDVVRPEAKRAIRRLLDARLELDGVFSDSDAALDSLARLSGGNVRDVFRLVLRAAELAEPERIEVDHVARASVWLAGQRTPLMTAADWRRAVQIDATKRVRNSQEDAHLLLHSCVLSYDGLPWWDVHPIVRADPEFERVRLELDE